MKLWEMTDPELDVVFFLESKYLESNNMVQALAETSLRTKLPTNQIIKMYSEYVVKSK